MTDQPTLSHNSALVNVITFTKHIQVDGDTVQKLTSIAETCVATIVLA